MAQYYYFFNSTLGDRRRYVAQDLADYFGDVLSTGLLHTDKIPELKVSVETGTMNTVVSPGRAIMKGHRYVNTSPLKLEHRLPEPDLDRIDRIVLRLDMRHTERNILLHIIEGESADNPVPPELQRDNFIYEISLAQIRIRAGMSTIKPEDLRDERLDEDLCGLVYSLISIPTSQFLEQWDLFFNAKRDEINTESGAILQQLADDLIQFNNDWDAWFSNQQTEGFVMANEKGQPDGIPSLDSEGKVPHEQLPPMDYVPLSEKGAPGGVATLDNEGNISDNQLNNVLFKTTDKGLVISKRPIKCVDLFPVVLYNFEFDNEFLYGTTTDYRPISRNETTKEQLINRNYPQDIDNMLSIYGNYMFFGEKGSTIRRVTKSQYRTMTSIPTAHTRLAVANRSQAGSRTVFGIAPKAINKLFTIERDIRKSSNPYVLVEYNLDSSGGSYDIIIENLQPPFNYEKSGFAPISLVYAKNNLYVLFTTAESQNLSYIAVYSTSGVVLDYFFIVGGQFVSSVGNQKSEQIFYKDSTMYIQIGYYVYELTI